jgi:hypothetical protein
VPITFRISSLKCIRSVYSEVKSNCFPAVFNASENLASKNATRSRASDARRQPRACATFSTSCGVLATRTKKATFTSARRLSRQTRPFSPMRSISIRFTEMSMTSIRWMTGRTTIPSKETFVPPMPVRMIAVPCSTLR